MHVSVIIPTYNSEHCIERTINSVLAQTYKNFEINVIDDGSKDNTKSVLEKYSDKINVVCQNNSGVCAARNRGIEISKGEWITFLDHDDTWNPDKLARQVKLLQSNPNLMWCATNYAMDNGQRCAAVKDSQKIKNALGQNDYFPSYFRAEGTGIIRLMPTGVMINRKVFNESGMFDASRRRSEDTDLWCRIAPRFPEIGFIPEVLATRYLDVQVNDEVIKLRSQQGTGAPMREVLSKYLDLAKEYNILDDYKIFARNELRKIIAMCLYRGNKIDAIKTIQEFDYLFKWHFRMGVRILTISPSLTKQFLHLAAYLAYITGIDKQATRRFLKSQ